MKLQGVNRIIKIAAIIILVISLFPDCLFNNLLDKSQKNKDDGEKEMQFFLLWRWYSAKISCEIPGSIDFYLRSGIFKSCNSNVVSSGLIYDATALTWLNSPAITGNNSLECHNAQFVTPANACGNSWYMYPGINPPPGAAVSLVFTHSCTYDGGGNVTSVNSFSAYSIGNTYYCLSQLYEEPFQIIVPQ